jgi:thiamine biosynthesis lipoprotein
LDRSALAYNHAFTLCITIALAFALALSSCGRAPSSSEALAAADPTQGNPAPNELRTETRDGLLGTIVTISAYSDSDSAFSDCFGAIADVDRRMTANAADSEIAAVNAVAGKKAAEVSDDTHRLLLLARDIYEQSGGAFDVSIGSVSSLWKEDGKFARLPERSEIEAKLPLVSQGGIVLSEGNTVRIDKAGAMLDLGGIAKGYACDLVLERLKEHGVSGAFIDLGGNIYAHGRKPGGKKWRVGIRYPEIGDDAVACVLNVSDRAVVTSGGYERYIERGGATYHHILDPKTGYPAESGLRSVTIVAASSTLADALSTACFVLGLEGGKQLLEKYPECEAIFITDDNTLYTTDGLGGQVEITDSRIKLG